MKLALISIPKHDKTWIPPAFVLEHWQVGCYIEFINEDDVEVKRAIIMESLHDYVLGST